MPMNMSYCRFENTLRALPECQDALENLFEGGDEARRLSDEETDAAQGLIKTCLDILQLVGDQKGFDILSEDGERLDDNGMILEILCDANDAVVDEE